MSGLSRKSFLFTGLGLAGIATFFGWTKKKVKPKPSLKFLSQDGTLMEIDATHLPASRRNATKEDIQNWIKRK